MAGNDDGLLPGFCDPSAQLLSLIKNLNLNLTQSEFENGRTIATAEQRSAAHCNNVPPAWQQTVC
jgi:hypothetical protein